MFSRTLLVIVMATVIGATGCVNSPLGKSLAHLNSLNDAQLDQFLKDNSVTCEKCEESETSLEVTIQTSKRQVMPNDPETFLISFEAPEAMQNVLSNKGVSLNYRLCPHSGKFDVVAVRKNEEYCLNLQLAPQYSFDNKKLDNRYHVPGSKFRRSGVVAFLPAIEGLYFLETVSTSEGGCFGYSFTGDYSLRSLTDDDLRKLDYIVDHNQRPGS